MTGPKIFTPEYYARLRDLEARGWWNAAMRDVMSLLLEDADLPARGSMLDVGCGSGQTMAWVLAERPGWTASGLDVSAEPLEAARGLGLTTVSRASALQLPHRDSSVDLIVTLDVLQHLPLDGGDLRALKEMHRVLRPGGELFVRTNAQRFPRVRDDRDHDFHRYTPRELGAKLEQAGFTVQRLSRLNALLGVLEIPRELRARRHEGHGYHGTLARARPTRGDDLKRAWLRLEGRAVRAGMRLPAGGTIVARCRA